MGSTGGWNRPATNQPVRKGGAKAPSAIKGIIVGGIAVAVGIACILMFSGGEDAPKAKPDKERGRIKEVTPAAAPTSAVPVKVEVEVEKPKGFKSKYSSRIFKTEDEMKAWEADNVIRPGIKTGKKPMPTINYVESEIHHIVNSNPNDPYLETPLPTKHFDERMLEALMHKMEPEEDDTPERKEQIRRVEEAKAFLRKELKAGKDLRQVMMECKQEMRDASRQVEFLKGEIRAAAKAEGATLADMKDLEQAANTILEKKGIDAKVKMSGVDRRRLELQSQGNSDRKDDPESVDVEKATN